MQQCHSVGENCRQDVWDVYTVPTNRLPSNPANKDRRATHTCFGLVEAHQCGILMVDVSNVPDGTLNCSFLIWRSKTTHVGIVTLLIFRRNALILCLWEHLRIIRCNVRIMQLFSLLVGTYNNA